MALTRAACVALAALAATAACSPDFSPNTYNAAAVQQANKVEQGVVAGVRDVDVKVSGTTGAVAGAAAGGIVGSQLPGSSTAAALGTVGGSLIGGLLGSGVERAGGDTKAYEYIVRKPNNDLISVTQTDKVPMVLGQHVLVIAGSQARIVPDYTTPIPEPIKPEPPRSAPVKVEPAKPSITEEALPPVAAPTTPPAFVFPNMLPTSLSPAISAVGAEVAKELPPQ